MKRSISKTGCAAIDRLATMAVLMTLLLFSVSVRAGIIGETGTAFSLTASEGYVSVADGGSIYAWGYSTGSTMQLPGPTLIVNQGDTITVTLKNALPAAAGNVSIVFPGHQVTATSGGAPGLLTQEALPGGTVTYTFVAGEPGTYQYHSGTQTDLQVEMGLYGALIVRPSAAALSGAGVSCVRGTPAYVHAATCYDREYLYLLSEIDIDVHRAAEAQIGGTGPIRLPAGTFASEYWLMNGRVGPDTMAASSVPGQGVLPTQPYGSLTRMHPGERLLMRVVGAGREMHPFHHHGNHARLLAVDGRMLLNSNGKLAGPLLFTIPSIPGQTADAIFEWTGKDLGWDMYGHAAGDGSVCIPDSNGYYTSDPNAANYMEWCADHNQPIPVTLPDLTNLAFGGFYSGSPFLGYLGSLPPGEGGLNPNAGFAFMWHSHTERELVNNDVFPGGMMTMLIVEAPYVVIQE
ncbi:MAG: multicopper oxidase domain-containing protein [Gammaproteobacteria bacterium]|nr:multicopper oxidase domain-containing protein [Gammaproteobacteria bacterium]